MDEIKLDKSKQKIESMFDEIAPTYDKLNHLFTFNIDIRWRKQIVQYIRNKNIPSESILDLASGTGDLTKELLQLEPKRVCAADISQKMLDIQRSKISDSRLELVRCDALSLPFANDAFDIITIGFGVRNFEDLKGSLKEIARVLKPGGKLIILEMFKAYGLRAKLFNIYFGKIMPAAGNKLSKSKYAYSYLFKSVRDFYSTGEFIKVCLENGFDTELLRNNFLGIVNTVFLNNCKQTRIIYFELSLPT